MQSVGSGRSGHNYDQDRGSESGRHRNNQRDSTGQFSYANREVEVVGVPPCCGRDARGPAVARENC